VAVGAGWLAWHADLEAARIVRFLPAPVDDIAIWVDALHAKITFLGR
jgi:hypothetical protein